MKMQSYIKNCATTEPTQADLALETFRHFFPLIDCLVSPDAKRMTYKIRGGTRTAPQWFKTAAGIISDNNLPLEAKTSSNILGRNYSEVKLLITVKNHSI